MSLLPPMFHVKHVSPAPGGGYRLLLDCGHAYDSPKVMRRRRCPRCWGPEEGGPRGVRKAG